MHETFSTKARLELEDLLKDVDLGVIPEGSIEVIADPNPILNRSEDDIIVNIEANIRRGLPQLKPHPDNDEQIAIVCGGPSLEHTVDELRDCVFQGYKLVAINNAYNWLIDHNIKPSAAVCIDSRPFNARFYERDVPGCRYFFSSQCDPSVFDMCEGRDVTIFHTVIKAENFEDDKKDRPGYKWACTLDKFYGGHWMQVASGPTATLKALLVFKILGFRYFDIFGFDSCILNEKHHVYEQNENNEDINKARVIYCGGKEFLACPWHIGQADAFLKFMCKHAHKYMKIDVHGDGLIKHMMKTAAKMKLNDNSKLVKFSLDPCLAMED